MAHRDNQRRQARSYLVVAILGLGGAALAMLAEMGRIALKGRDYSLATFNHAYYYRALAAGVRGSRDHRPVSLR